VIDLRIKHGEPREKARRRRKKKLGREGTWTEVRNHRQVGKPREAQRRRMKVAKFNAMLSARYADM
jgi:ribosomal protein S21